ncbi:MAG: roadblock/LC7 domain-containing protein [Promethearchaeota archaeon]
MTKPLIDNLNNILIKLENIAGILGSAIINRNGLLITARLPRNIDDRKFGAMVATMFGAFETATNYMKSNIINHITVEFSSYQLIIFSVSEQLIIVALLELNINIGLVFIEIEEAINEINEIYNR